MLFANLILVGLNLYTVRAISIDNHLQVIKIDCYERLAIGARINSNNIYKSFPYNTVTDCKKVCSQEKDTCKGFSFGISAKGNATCELTTKTIKETPDLKPIDAIKDTDFDLYVKKHDCTIVTEPKQTISLGNTNPPKAFGNVQEDQITFETNDTGIHKVQTIVSVAAGHNTAFHPVHGLIVSDDGNFYQNYGFYGDIERYDTKRYDYDYRRHPIPEKYGSFIPHPNYYKKPTHYDYPKPQNQPYSEYLHSTLDDKYLTNTQEKPVHEKVDDNKKPVRYETETTNKRPASGYGIRKPIVSQNIGYGGNKFTSVITEIRDKACFRRVLAGKRISRGLVRKALTCEAVEECQAECADEKIFSCEGFNYRLDPSGRGRGDCELLSIPFSRLDIYFDSYPDPNYDYYERDRNGAATNCRRGQLTSHKSSQYHSYNDYDDYRHGLRDVNPQSWVPRRKYDYPSPPHPLFTQRRYDYRAPSPSRWHDRPYESLPSPPRRRGDYSYLPPNNPPLLSVPHPYLPPPRHPNNWDGLYKKNQKNNYWGFGKQDGGQYGRYGGGQYLPPDEGLKPPLDEDDGNVLAVASDSSFLPVEHRRPTFQDDCSLRSAMGFKLNKRIVKKYFSVPNIYECELLCFKETDFLCASYAYRYTITVSEPTDNCYLSNVDYKEIDNYSDLIPDRDFDVYTMNNKNRCDKSSTQYEEISDCFWRVRSGERFNEKIVRDSLKVDNVIDCEIECLKSRKFTCRAFSYRYGSPIIGGLIDNCQLTDWPHHELDKNIHLSPETGFEIYERGSFGYGCEMARFGQHKGHSKPVFNPNQLCYIGFGTPARLLAPAIKKSILVATDIDCKEECSKARIQTLFQCMSFSFRTTRGSSTNCDLSDIYQRDLLPKLDYIYDPDSLLFAWDNYNPECVILDDDTNHIPNGLHEREYLPQVLDTWSVYSVSGKPCKRGARCRQNYEAGFWFCELEGSEKGAWDYCCRPEHQCGASNGYPYLWCYVGPEKTQWRKCNDKYYPYFGGNDRNYLIANRKPDRPIFRPDRLPAPTRIPLQTPTLNEYESLFDEQFLQPPTPGGFGQPRHWPLSYLHKEVPPNITITNGKNVKMSRMENIESKYEAIQNLINAIKSDDLKDIQYQISNSKNDVLLLKIPLPTNFTVTDSNNNNSNVALEPITVTDEETMKIRKEKSLYEITPPQKFTPTYRRAFITRTNVTTHGKQEHLSHFT